MLIEFSEKIMGTKLSKSQKTIVQFIEANKLNKLILCFPKHHGRTIVKKELQIFRER